MRVSTTRNVSEEMEVLPTDDEVFPTIQVELDANNHDWIWLYAKEKKRENEAD